MMLGVVVAQVSDAWLPVHEELTLACAITYQIKAHVNRFRSFLFDGVVGEPSEVELSTWIGVASCGCPSPRSKVRIGTDSWPLM